MLRLPDPDDLGAPERPAEPERPEGPARRGAARRARNPLFRAIPGGGEGGDAPRAPGPAADGRAAPGPASAWEALGGRASLPGGAGDEDAPATPEAGGEAPGSPRRGRARRASTDGTAHQPECYACPIGALFTEARGARPETTAHLLAAAEELTAAARSLLESFETALGRTQGRTATKVQRVKLD